MSCKINKATFKKKIVMKKISTLLAVIGMIVISSCTGPQGPPGYDGLNGQNGTNGLISEVFELKNVNFY